MLPLPLLKLSDEDKVDSIMQEWEEIPNDELPNIELNAKCVRAKEESWVYVITCTLNYLNMRQPGLPHMQGA